jgi:hypothetical protein
MIITIVCAVIVVVASSFILPFLFKIDNQLISMLEMSINIKKDVAVKMVGKISNFDQYVQTNTYYQKYIAPDKLLSTENYDEETEKEKPNVKQISYISVNLKGA